MGATSIQWTDFTFNPWWGCTKVSAGCKSCYAERDSKRYGYEVWGKSERRYFGDAYWSNPLTWNKKAERAGTRLKVFCASMADVFEDLAGFPDEEIIRQARAQFQLWRTIKETPWLDWQILTKRPENILRDCPRDVIALPNAWFGTSAEDQETLDARWAHLKKVPARILFLSLEPLLARVDASRVFGVEFSDAFGWLPEQIHVLGGHRSPDWVIVGGESGGVHQARMFDLAWVRTIIEQARGALGQKKIAVFVKQFGARVHADVWGVGRLPQLAAQRDQRVGQPPRWALKAASGGDCSEWPEDLAVREFPA